MQYIKLQLGCMLAVLYIVITYIRTTLKSKIPCNWLFDGLMIAAPQAIFFDGLTAWTVNHTGLVPDMVNRIAHLFFFLAMDVTVIITALYMYDQLIGIRKNDLRKWGLFVLPGGLALILVAAGIGQLEFIQGVTTAYSMGFSVYVSFATLIVYYGSILYLIITRRRFLPREKVLGTLSFIVIAGVILTVQICLPEALLSSIFPTILLLGIYIDFETPAIQKLTIYNNEIVEGFATMVESRDNNTGGHIKRTKAYVDLILRKMRHDKRYTYILNRDYLTDVSNAAPLHDIGKISTPDSILQKPGKLTDQEYAIMKEHAAKGGEIIRTAFHNLEDPEFRQIAYEVARYHHEKYNGKGYPDGLSGEQIPLHARIMAIADVFDAVSQKRCYRDAIPLEESFAIIEKGSGTDFDPALAGLFLDAREDVTQIVKEAFPPVS